MRYVVTAVQGDRLLGYGFAGKIAAFKRDDCQFAPLRSRIKDDDYVFVPVPSGGMQPAHLQAFRQAVDRHEGPFLAYCRSGTRSCHLWAFAAARTQPAQAVIDAAAGAGYDLSGAAPMLQRIAAENARS